MKKLSFNAVILSTVLIALSSIALLLLIPAYQGSQKALSYEINSSHDQNQRILQRFFKTYLQSVAAQIESISRRDELLQLIEQGNREQARSFLNNQISGQIGESTHAFALTLKSSSNIEVFNTALLGQKFPLNQLTLKFAPDRSWIKQRHTTPDSQNHFLRISFPIISHDFGEVVATLHAFILLNENFIILNEIQSLTSSTAAVLFDGATLISGLSLNKATQQLLTQHNPVNKFSSHSSGQLVHQYNLQINRSDTISARVVVPNSSLMQLQRSYTSNLGPAIIAALLIGAITVVLIGYLTRSSLSSLVKYADEMGEAKESEPFIPGRFEEFNRLGRTLESMVSKISEHEKQLNGIIENTPNVIFIKGIDLHYQMVSPNYGKLTNLPLDEVVGKTDSDIYPAEHAAALRESDTRVIQRRAPQQIEYTLETSEGPRSFLSTKFPLIDDNDIIYAIGGIITDITDLKTAQSRIQLAGQIFDQADEAILALDSNLNVISVNSACIKLTGFPTNQTDRFVSRLLHDIPEISEHIESGARWNNEAQIRKQDGSSFSAWLSLSTIINDADEQRYVIIFNDISALKSAETQLEKLSHYDTLTGLPNRSLFFDRLESAIARSGREGSKTALLFLNIDRFKNINDTYGHAVGDELLIAAANRINGQIRPDDTVSRLGGDEFGVILQGISHPDTINLITHRIQETLRVPFQLNDFSSSAPVSIGIAVYPDDGLEPKALLSHADTAMYHVKEQGRNGIQYYDQELNKQAEAQTQLEEDLRRALINDELFMVYQPRFDIDGETILSAEALVRWDHPEQGLIPPIKFIPLAEQTGQIVELGRYILLASCKAAKSWNDNPDWPMPVSVNLSARQIYDPSLIDDISFALKESGLPPELLELEITETLEIDDIDTVIDKLIQIRQMGIRMSVDDFGTGYSSLIYLKRLPVDTVKIDRSFVTGVPGNGDDEKIISAIISMSHSLQLSVVAEGVETEEQLNFLRELNCDEIQGYLLGKPGPAEVMIAHTKQTRREHLL
ncbi:EAL domain-containing protein [Neptuniibacter sp.]|uniref:EAL domain-containing protein n=1 Tax=Neptuniibacter sp. TaxID=1962643 RepID=UPI002614D7C7|nr:EAL domain-containing protein [Neptuniibacter sp.]MCP4595159.1 EAL domain-containing protein [Neptuniibacter sp.]